MDSHSDLDTSSKLEYESDQGSAPGSDCDEDKLSKNLEPCQGHAEQIKCGFN